MTIIIAGVIIILGISFGIGILFKNNGTITLTTCAAALVTFGIFVAMAAGIVFGYPVYKVWEQSKAGEAALAKATQDRQIKVQEAKAEMEAASKQAEANRILGKVSVSTRNPWNRNGSKPSKRHRTRSSTCRPKLPSPSQKAPVWHRKHRNKE